MNISDPHSPQNAPDTEDPFYSSHASESAPSPLSPHLATQPWELAQSTLANLLEYSEILERMCDQAADLLGSDRFFESFTRLIDGIDLFAQGIDGVKRILNTISPNHSPELRKMIDLLELDLLSNLRNLLKCQEDRDQEHLEAVLRLRLPRSLQDWRQTGIPSLIRARDC